MARKQPMERQFVVRDSAENYDHLRRVAERERVPISQLVRYAIRKYIRETKIEKDDLHDPSG